MAVNARTEEFQHIEVFDKPALFTNGRIARDTVPKGWYCYDIRGSDDDPGELCYMEENVVVNHAGSVLMPEKLAMPKLLGEAANADDAETYMERFQSLSEGMEDLKRRKAGILQIRQEQDAVSRRLQASAAALDAVSTQITEWDENTVYQLLEKVTVLEGFKIRVTFRNGQEIEQSIDQPKRRKRI